MADYKDILKQFKESLGGRGEESNKVFSVSADTIDIIEGSNASISADSKRYKEGNKYIFKQHIGYESAQDIVNSIIATENITIKNLVNYKDDIYQKALYSFEQGENPIEMMIYATRGITEELHKDAILDKIKDLVLDYRKDVIEAYRNILMNWSFDDCVELVLKSIGQCMLFELSSEVFKTFELKVTFRRNAACVLVDLEAEEKFESMINFLAVNTGESNEETDIFREIVQYLVRNNESGSRYVYNVFKNVRCSNIIRNILSGGVKYKVTNEIYDDIEKKLQDKNSNTWITNRLLNFINRLSKSERAIAIAKRCEKYEHIDKSKLDILVDSDYISLVNSINNLKESYAIRRNSLIRFATSKDIEKSKKQDFISKFAADTEKMKIIKSSALVELGSTTEMITLLKYLVATSDKELIEEAMHQIKRLRTMNNQEINVKLLNAITKFLAYDDESNIGKFEIIIDLYHTGIPRDDVGKVFLTKLKNTQHSKIKKKLLIFFSKNYYNFSMELKDGIRNQIIKESEYADVHNEAMESLKRITILDTSIPESI